MHIYHHFDSEKNLVITVGGQSGEDRVKISREEMLKWLGLKDMLDAYKLAEETAEKL